MLSTPRKVIPSARRLLRQFIAGNNAPISTEDSFFNFDNPRPNAEGIVRPSHKTTYKPWNQSEKQGFRDKNEFQRSSKPHSEQNGYQQNYQRNQSDTPNRPSTSKGTIEMPSLNRILDHIDRMKIARENGSIDYHFINRTLSELFSEFKMLKGAVKKNCWLAEPSMIRAMEITIPDELLTKASSASGRPTISPYLFEPLLAEYERAVNELCETGDSKRFNGEFYKQIIMFNKFMARQESLTVSKKAILLYSRLLDLMAAEAGTQNNGSNEEATLKSFSNSTITLVCSALAIGEFKKSRRSIPFKANLELAYDSMLAELEKKLCAVISQFQEKNLMHMIDLNALYNSLINIDHVVSQDHILTSLKKFIYDTSVIKMDQISKKQELSAGEYEELCSLAAKMQREKSDLHRLVGLALLEVLNRIRQSDQFLHELESNAKLSYAIHRGSKSSALNEAISEANLGAYLSRCAIASSRSPEFLEKVQSFMFLVDKMADMAMLDDNTLETIQHEILQVLKLNSNLVKNLKKYDLAALLAILHRVLQLSQNYNIEFLEQMFKVILEGETDYLKNSITCERILSELIAQRAKLEQKQNLKPYLDMFFDTCLKEITINRHFMHETTTKIYRHWTYWYKTRKGKDFELRLLSSAKGLDSILVTTSLLDAYDDGSLDEDYRWQLDDTTRNRMEQELQSFNRIFSSMKSCQSFLTAIYEYTTIQRTLKVLNAKDRIVTDWLPKIIDRSIIEFAKRPDQLTDWIINWSGSRFRQQFLNLVTNSFVLSSAHRRPLNEEVLNSMLIYLKHQRAKLSVDNLLAILTALLGGFKNSRLLLSSEITLRMEEELKRALDQGGSSVLSAVRMVRYLNNPANIKNMIKDYLVSNANAIDSIEDSTKVIQLVHACVFIFLDDPEVWPVLLKKLNSSCRGLSAQLLNIIPKYNNSSFPKFLVMLSYIKLIKSVLRMKELRADPEIADSLLQNLSKVQESLASQEDQLTRRTNMWTSTILQDEVINLLRSLKIEYEEEPEVFGLRVDFRLKDGTLLEVLGSVHFNDDGAIDSHTLVRRRILESLGEKVRYVNFQELKCPLDTQISVMKRVLQSKEQPANSFRIRPKLKATN